MNYEATDPFNRVEAARRGDPCPLHGKPRGPLPATNCEDCRAEIDATLVDNTAAPVLSHEDLDAIAQRATQSALVSYGTSASDSATWTDDRILLTVKERDALVAEVRRLRDVPVSEYTQIDGWWYCPRFIGVFQRDGCGFAEHIPVFIEVRKEDAT